MIGFIKLDIALNLYLSLPNLQVHSAAFIQSKRLLKRVNFVTSLLASSVFLMVNVKV